METRRFDDFTRLLSRRETRRGVLEGLAGIVGLGSGAGGAGRTRKRRKPCRTCCRANASPCGKKSRACKPGNCLRAPFTVEVVWESDSDHDTYVFVPNDAGAALPGPYISYSCNPANSDCEDDFYPFTCVSQDASGPGDEVTTVRRLLAGQYQYWIGLESIQGGSPAGDLTVILRDGGRPLRSWTSPEGSPPDNLSWHVFDLDGRTGSVTSVNQLVSGPTLPQAAFDPSTEVCPGLE